MKETFAFWMVALWSGVLALGVKRLYKTDTIGRFWCWLTHHKHHIYTEQVNVFHGFTNRWHQTYKVKCSKCGRTWYGTDY